MIIPEVDPVFGWTHLELIFSILIPIGIAWYTTRKDNERMHRENQDRLIEIETKMEAVWLWYQKLGRFR